MVQDNDREPDVFGEMNSETLAVRGYVRNFGRFVGIALRYMCWVEVMACLPILDIPNLSIALAG